MIRARMAEIRIQNTGVDRGCLETRVADLSAGLAKTAIFWIFTHASRTYADGGCVQALASSSLLLPALVQPTNHKALIVD
jgi:hypothetical protein